MGALCAAQEEMPNMWLHRMAYLSVALVCRELRYAVIVCDNVRAHPAAATQHGLHNSSTDSQQMNNMPALLSYHMTRHV